MGCSYCSHDLLRIRKCRLLRRNYVAPTRSRVFPFEALEWVGLLYYDVMKDLLVGLQTFDISALLSIAVIFGVCTLVVLILYHGWEEVSGLAVHYIAIGVVCFIIVGTAFAVVWSIWDFIRVEPEQPTKTESTGSEWGSYYEGY